MPAFDSGARPYGLSDALAELLQGEKKETPKGKPVLHLITDTYEKVTVSDTADAVTRPSRYTVEHALALRYSFNYSAALSGGTLSIPLTL
jgi:hypothetical protein